MASGRVEENHAHCQSQQREDARELERRPEVRLSSRDGHAVAEKVSAGVQQEQEQSKGSTYTRQDRGDRRLDGGTDARRFRAVSSSRQHIW